MQMLMLSLGEFLWSLLVFFFMVVYFMMLFGVVVDVFRRHDASGWKKAGWLAFLFFLPLIGLLAYMITNSEGMAERSTGGRYGGGYQEYATNGAGTAEIVQAKSLLDSGAITPDEYERIKARALA
jgi:hypothetical protein